MRRPSSGLSAIADHILPGHVLGAGDNVAQARA